LQGLAAPVTSNAAGLPFSPFLGKKSKILSQFRQQQHKSDLGKKLHQNLSHYFAAFPSFYAC
jgi:hypothetical protein